ncbi:MULTISPECIES: sigma-54-dependent Fis family transcriptional regulator [Xanthomonas translucens group]|uniref:Sigma-54-dependent Fis family transcriptional regulator n=1 Tax=Xanthomonas cerealis pv. cerealis TaxID=152263 RepID=A0A514EGP7_9XANT|nr:sigma-54-dependent Fis family transcriptional regulator [Xanthomonas translucens]QDI05176.1 sigma-54-dependent Fis family transcriptional regulator [Xanthomonas translucens pv. cerealis]UKE47219.1 sigma-54-dependent Fis family transcriptional regulator [Xanthomonas translucens pv. cerealis]
MAHQQSQHQLGHARRIFFERGGAPVGQVPDTILQSWQRCQRLGLPAQGTPPIEPVSAPRLRELRAAHERLWRLARAELDGLAGDVAATGSIVLLTNEDGWILDAEGSPGFLDKAGRVALMPGACWSETQVGTNAIGTAIVESRSVEVRGGEHYFAPHRILSCAAVPIFDPYGQLTGVLDISGDASVQHMHALGLARRAVASIEHRYFDDAIAECELLRVHHDPALLGTAHEGLLAFRNGTLVAANQAGLRLFGLERHDLGRAPHAALFEQPLSQLRQHGSVIDLQGRALHGRVDSAGEALPRRRSPPPPPITVSTATHAQPHADAPLFDAAQELALERARRVLDAQLPVLVQGETGTGKEMFARELHRRSARAGKPFVAVNCVALPEGLIEAELFGYEDGAFTGARKHGSPGLLRQAEGGVLFLDEIGDMPLALQPRLLRVLQERELLPLGGGKPVKLDFALICATHRDLDEAMAEHRFRPDLYYRIAQHGVQIPALRVHPDRRGVVQELWARVGQGRRMSAAALAALSAYAWPGNLRQLVACLRTLVALSDAGAVVDADALPAYLPGAARRMHTAGGGATPGQGGSQGEPHAMRANAPLTRTDLDSLALAAMRQALEACGGNVAGAARQLGISRSTLYRRLGLGMG